MAAATERRSSSFVFDQPRQIDHVRSLTQQRTAGPPSFLTPNRTQATAGWNEWQLIYHQRVVLPTAVGTFHFHECSRWLAGVYYDDAATLALRLRINTGCALDRLRR